MTITFQVRATVGRLKNAVLDGAAGGKIQGQMVGPLTTKLNLAQAALDAGNVAGAKAALADFIGLVVSQAGKKIDAKYADLLIRWANDLIARL